MSGWYVGGDIAKVDIESEDDTGFRILGGYEINRTFAAELGYTSLFDKDGVEVTAVELVGIGKFPVANSFPFSASWASRCGTRRSTVSAPTMAPT